MSSTPVDEYEMPEITAEMLADVLPQELPLGSSQVTVRSRKWTEQYWPQPPGPGVRALDVLIAIMFTGSIILMLRACSWAVFN